MANRRIDLHERLCELLGSRQVYYQQPETRKMHYPAIVYDRSRINQVFADDLTYLGRKQYTLTLIYEDPDSDLPDKILSGFSLISHNRAFNADNLHHDVYELYW